MNRDQKGDLVEQLIFEVYKDKFLESSNKFKTKIKQQYGYNVSFDLYAKLINYQINKYGEALFPCGEGYDKWRLTKTRKIRKRNKDHVERRVATIKFLERIEKNEENKAKRLTKNKNA